MKSLICFKVGKKVSNSNETKEQVEQLQDKPSEETITEGEIKTDVGKQATYLDNFIETKEKWEQLKEQLEQLQEQLETASGTLSVLRFFVHFSFCSFFLSYVFMTLEKAVK